MKRELKFPLKGKYVVMLAPSFVVDFKYPEIIFQLRALGFDKVVEVTFGAKMINRLYHSDLKNSNKILISSVCPGVVDFVKNNYPNMKDSLILVDSPMIAMAKICRKIYPKHKIVFISPCNFKKIEAENSKFIEGVLTFKELKNILPKVNSNCSDSFDKFYNDYTKIYPLSGGLSKTAHLKGILKPEEVKIIDGVQKVKKFLDNYNPEKSNVRFLDVCFCEGGCIGGPEVNSRLPIFLRKRKVLKYLKQAKCEDIPEIKKGLVKKAKGISFRRKSF
jgi:iron only hydrogenase large subunit-like protein